MNPLLMVGAGILALAGLASLAGKKKRDTSYTREAFYKTAGTPDPKVPTSTLSEVPISARTMLRQGSRGADVVVWQRVIGAAQDGIFGPLTDKGTRGFQREHGLVVDGIVGPKTWTVAYSMYR